MAEYGIMLGTALGDLAAQMPTSLGAIFNKLFQNPMLLGLVVGSIIFLGLWFLKGK